MGVGSCLQSHLYFLGEGGKGLSGGGDLEEEGEKEEGESDWICPSKGRMGRRRERVGKKVRKSSLTKFANLPKDRYVFSHIHEYFSEGHFASKKSVDIYFFGGVDIYFFGESHTSFRVLSPPPFFLSPIHLCATRADIRKLPPPPTRHFPRQKKIQKKKPSRDFLGVGCEKA